MNFLVTLCATAALATVVMTTQALDLKNDYLVYQSGAPITTECATPCDERLYTPMLREKFRENEDLLICSIWHENCKSVTSPFGGADAMTSTCRVELNRFIAANCMEKRAANQWVSWTGPVAMQDPVLIPAAKPPNCMLAASSHRAVRKKGKHRAWLDYNLRLCVGTKDEKIHLVVYPNGISPTAAT